MKRRDLLGTLLTAGLFVLPTQAQQQQQQQPEPQDNPTAEVTHAKEGVAGPVRLLPLDVILHARVTSPAAAQTAQPTQTTPTESREIGTVTDVVLVGAARSNRRRASAEHRRAQPATLAPAAATSTPHPNNPDTSNNPHTSTPRRAPSGAAAVVVELHGDRTSPHQITIPLHAMEWHGTGKGFSVSADTLANAPEWHGFDHPTSRREPPTMSASALQKTNVVTTDDVTTPVRAIVLDTRSGRAAFVLAGYRDLIQPPTPADKKLNAETQDPATPQWREESVVIPWPMVRVTQQGDQTRLQVPATAVELQGAPKTTADAISRYPFNDLMRSAAFYFHALRENRDNDAGKHGNSKNTGNDNGDSDSDHAHHANHANATDQTPQTDRGGSTGPRHGS